jgi:hypothetical protein
VKIIFFAQIHSLKVWFMFLYYNIDLYRDKFVGESSSSFFIFTIILVRSFHSRCRWLIFIEESMGHTRWLLSFQPNFLHTHEPKIKPLTTCLREPRLLPLRSVYCWLLESLLIREVWNIIVSQYFNVSLIANRDKTK